MKIIHISDLHLDAVYKPENYKRTLRILEYITATGFDHLVITGDITENGESSSLTLARNLLRKFGLLCAEKTTIIIGNHDIYGGVHLAEDVVNFPGKCRNTDYYKKVAEFTSAFEETYTNTISSKKKIYPFVKEFDEFILLGLNSIAQYSVLKNPFASNGFVSAGQTEDAEKMISPGKYDNKKVIALVHHHFCKEPVKPNTSESSMWQKIEKQTMKMKKKKSLIRFLKKINTDLVLHGHLHESAAYTRKGLKFLNAGGSVLDSGKTFLNINRLDILDGKIITSTESIRASLNEPFNSLTPLNYLNSEVIKAPASRSFSLN